ncbi:MAG: isoleucine--tRNA ligase [Nitrospinota bacterium]|nr:MAG: isoleucine--tRNA ligase [Nitrospinota bacterium]
MVDYKETLNLPKTAFPMKANLLQLEPAILAEWEKENLYQMMRQRFADRPLYILHDGPPYANGHIHLGTALNKILKDFVNKVKTMEGFNAVYVPGWDCHGLPIEHQVDRELGPQKLTMSKVEIRQRCREFANRFINIQREEFKRLGVLGDWDHPYLTMDYRFEADIVRELAKFIANGSLYKGLKPVHWCTSCKTALAEAEVEYEEHRSPSIYVKFPVQDEFYTRYPVLQGKPASVLIWTTTPWTLPANLAICLHPEFEYVAVEAQGEVFILVKDLVDEVMRKCEIQEYTVLSSFPGTALEGLKCRHPFLERDSLLILGDHVTLDQGTGCVHTAPGHGQEDFEIGIKYGLEVYNPVGEEGDFLPDTPYFAGKKVWDANADINALLRERGMLVKEEEIEHAYPHCWRCKNPVIFRATEQWFISMEKNDLRKKALQKIREVEWIPPWGEERIYQMIEHRPDWCISRQRAWGVPITVFYCQECGELIASAELANYVADLMEEHGADIWFAREAQDLLPPGFSCPHCEGKSFRKEEDILDVWFDSGVTHAAVLERRPDLRWPSDMYLEGSDQHRGWFHSSLLTAVGTRGEAPYRTVLTHGYVVDGEGRKMAKSLGNVISPEEVIQKYGAEILRLWVSSENFREDIRVSDEILRQLVDAYRRIRNTCRFLLGNLSDFDPQRDRVPYQELPELERLMLHRLQQLIQQVRKAYDTYEYHLFYHRVHNFCTVDLSSFYLDIQKDNLYTSRAESKERRATQTVLFEILLALVKLMAPVLSFTAEEIWKYLPAGSVTEPSVHLSRFPDVQEAYIDEALASRWERLLAVRREVLKALEMARNRKLIGNALEARVTLYLSPDLADFLAPYAPDLRTLFIVSQVELQSQEATIPAEAYASSEIPQLHVLVERARGEKCERCWIYSETVGDDPRHPTLCDRCVSRIT